GAEDVFLDRGLDPPGGIGAEPEALLGREAFERSHQTDIALGDHVRDRQAVAAIPHGNLGDQAQMAGDELVRRLAVAVPAPALGQQALLLRFQHREPADFLKITRQAGSSRHTLIWDCEPNHHLPRMYARSNTFEIKLSELDPLVKLISKHYYMPMSARETAELLLQAGRLVQAEGYDGQLSPAQWMALRYFARANPFSRNPSAFAEFQATTRGTASQAIRALEAGGYLVRQRSKADGRSVSLRL